MHPSRSPLMRWRKSQQTDCALDRACWKDAEASSSRVADRLRSRRAVRRCAKGRSRGTVVQETADSPCRKQLSDIQERAARQTPHQLTVLRKRPASLKAIAVAPCDREARHLPLRRAARQTEICPKVDMGLHERTSVEGD